MTPLPLVMLPGLDGTGVFFRPLLAHLGPMFRPVVLPFPADQPLGYEELLPLILPKLPRDEPFVLLAESFSGPLALMLAATGPPGPIAVVLSATFIRNPTYLPARLLLPLAKPWLCAMYPAMSKFRVLRGKALNALTAEALSGAVPAVIAARLRAVLTVDAADALRRCPVPILYFCGGHDPVVPAKNSREMLAICPSMTIVEMPCSHLVLQTRPQAAAAAIRDFVEQNAFVVKTVF